MTDVISRAVRPFVASAAVQRVVAASLRTAQPTATAGLVSLAMGEPGFDTPPSIRLAAHAGMETGYTHYAHSNGDPESRETLARRVNRDHGTDYSAEQVVVTNGGTGGLAAAILAVVDLGDRVVIPDPTYSLYADLIRPARSPAHPSAAAGRPALGPRRTRRSAGTAQAFIFCNPSKPTGVVHTRDELTARAAMLAGRDTLVLSDEAYSKLVYTDAPFVSTLDVAGLVDRTLYCQTFSKAYAMTGWPLGYLAGDRDVIAAARVHALTAGPLNPATQRAALVAVDEPPAELTMMHEHYRIRRDLMIGGLADLAGLRLAHCAFYAFLRYDAELTAVAMVAHLWAHGVAVRPGSEFGAAREPHVRLLRRRPRRHHDRPRTHPRRLRPTLSTTRPEL